MRLFRAALAATAILATTACTAEADSAPPEPGGDLVVASTTWVGALAKAAGATNITVVAPAIIPDQARFDPTPAELAAVDDAEHIVYAETDGFAAELRNAAGDARLTSVKLGHDPVVIRAEVTRLGELFGTQRQAGQWLSAFEGAWYSLSESLKGLAPIPPSTAVAQVDVAHWAAYAGVKVVASYGPAQVTPDEVAALIAKKPKLLLANVHLPAGTPDIPGTIRVDLTNYPDEDLDLMAVFRTNGERIGATFAK